MTPAEGAFIGLAVFAGWIGLLVLINAGLAALGVLPEDDER